MSYLKKLVEAIKDPNLVILDTETTGIRQGEIVQIAILSRFGNPILDTLVKPKLPIPPDATRIHGITDELVKNAPTWETVAKAVMSRIIGRTVITYNAKYDRMMMHQTAERWNMPKVDWKAHATFVCAMEAYAEFWGDWNSYRHSYTWQSLTNATRQQHLEITDAHTALGDCLMTLALCEKITGATQ